MSQLLVIDFTSLTQEALMYSFSFMYSFLRESLQPLGSLCPWEVPQFVIFFIDILKQVKYHIEAIKKKDCFVFCLNKHRFLIINPIKIGGYESMYSLRGAFGAPPPPVEKGL